MMQSSAQYEWVAEDGSLIVRILAGVISTLSGEMGGRVGPQAEQPCGVLVGTTSSGVTPVVAVESLAALPIEAGSSGTATVQMLFDKWPRSRNRRVHAVGSYRVARRGAPEPSQPELTLTRGGRPFPAVELIVEGAISGGFAASICFQTRADRPIQTERLVFPREHQMPTAPTQSPAPAEAAATSFSFLDGVSKQSYLGRPSFWSRRVAIIIGAVAVLSAAGIAIKPYRPKPGTVQPNAHAVGVSTDLGLYAERSGGNVIATWNRQAKGIENATSGVLTVQEQDRRHDLILDREQLRAGSAAYPVTADELTIRLQVFSSRNTEVDTLRIINAATRRDAAPREDERRQWAPVPQPAARKQPKPFQTPAPRSVTSTLTPAPIADVPPDAPLAPRPAPVDAISVVALAVRPEPPRPNRIGADQSSRGRNEVPAGQQGSDVNARASEQLSNTAMPAGASGPVPVSPVSPVLSSNVRALIHTRVEVTVTVKVDTSGRVTDAAARMAGANSLGALGEFIRVAAVNAARLWRFEPARVNQHSVPGTCDIKFVFGPT